MRPKLHPATFLITLNQINWLEEESERTGLNKVEIVRRALDNYRDTQESKEQRRFFSPQQRQDIKEAARRKGIAEIEVIRDAVNRELRFMAKLYKNRQNKG